MGCRHPAAPPSPASAGTGSWARPGWPSTRGTATTCSRRASCPSRATARWSAARQTAWCAWRPSRRAAAALRWRRGAWPATGAAPTSWRWSRAARTASCPAAKVGGAGGWRAAWPARQVPQRSPCPHIHHSRLPLPPRLPPAAPADGEVRHFDLRQPAGAARRLLACRTQHGRLELNSVHCCPRSHQFCVAGGDPFVRCVGAAGRVHTGRGGGRGPRGPAGTCSMEGSPTKQACPHPRRVYDLRRVRPAGDIRAEPVRACTSKAGKGGRGGGARATSFVGTSSLERCAEAPHFPFAPRPSAPLRPCTLGGCAGAAAGALAPANAPLPAHHHLRCVRPAGPGAGLVQRRKHLPVLSRGPSSARGRGAERCGSQPTQASPSCGS
jgi:hypothetical protein